MINPKQKKVKLVCLDCRAVWINVLRARCPRCGSSRLEKISEGHMAEDKAIMMDKEEEEGGQVICK